MRANDRRPATISDPSRVNANPLAAGVGGSGGGNIFLTRISAAVRRFFARFHRQSLSYAACAQVVSLSLSLSLSVSVPLSPSLYVLDHS